MRTLGMVLLVAACGGGSGDGDDDGPVDASPDAVDPSHTFVVRDLDLPTSEAEAHAFAFNIDREETPPGDPDTVDNNLGVLIAQFHALALLSLQGPSDLALARGDALYLLDMRGDLTSGAAALHSYQGASAMPAPCAAPSDTECRKHLDGTATFTLGSLAAPAPLEGDLDGGAFDGNGAGGTLLVPFPSADRWVTLHRARADLQGIFTSNFTGRIGGAVRVDEALEALTYAYAPIVIPIFERDCVVGSSPQQQCQCTPGTDGEIIRGLFDKSPYDCQIPIEEVRSFWDPLDADVDLDGDGTDDAITFAVRIDAVSGAFTPPP